MTEKLPRPSELDPVLMNPKRFLITALLYMLGPRTMGFIQKSLGLSWGDLYSHLKALEEAGYVRLCKVITVQGPRTLVELTEREAEAYEKLAHTLMRVLQSLHSQE